MLLTVRVSSALLLPAFKPLAPGDCCQPGLKMCKQWNSMVSRMFCVVFTLEESITQEKEVRLAG